MKVRLAAAICAPGLVNLAVALHQCYGRPTLSLTQIAATKDQPIQIKDLPSER